MNKPLFLICVIWFLCLNRRVMSARIFEGKREMRAVWIATVNNMDWPSKPGMSNEEQKTELIAYLDLFKRLGFNAIVMQIRPCGDAFYPSAYEPWSAFLSGQQGIAPSYDPLQFAIDECHKRCMEFHAWLNPYRATMDNDYGKLSPNHLLKQHSEWFVVYQGKTYFDPAYPETRAFVCKVVKDIVSRYDIDAIHLDDYFYPYSDFNDSISFAKYNHGYSAQNKMAWRRENVNRLIKMLHNTIKSVKPYVKFGISPYAVWRNKRDDPRGSDTQSYSYTDYDNLYADVRLWLQKGWINYVIPQFYFAIGYKKLDFRVISDWWSDNSFGHTEYAGIGTYRLNSDAKDTVWRSTNEIAHQVEYIRANPKYSGFCYFNAKNFKDDVLGIDEIIEQQINPYPALIPIVPKMSGKNLIPTSNLQYDPKTFTLMWSYHNRDNKPADKITYFTVYRFKKGQIPDFEDASAIVKVVRNNQTRLNISDKGVFDYFVTALNRLYNESLPSKVIHIQQ